MSTPLASIACSKSSKKKDCSNTVLVANIYWQPIREQFLRLVEGGLDAASMCHFSI